MTRYLLVLATFLGAVAHANGISGIDCATKWKAADGYKDIDPLDTPFTCSGDVTAARELAKHIDAAACGSPAPGFICPTVTIRGKGGWIVYESAAGWRLTYDDEHTRWSLTGLPQRVPKGGPLDNTILLGGVGSARGGPAGAGPGGQITICPGHLDTHGDVIAADPACGVTQFHKYDNNHGAGDVYDQKNDCWHAPGHGCFNVLSGSGAVHDGEPVTVRSGTTVTGGISSSTKWSDDYGDQAATGGQMVVRGDTGTAYGGRITVEGVHRFRPLAGIRFFTGDYERVFLDGDGTLHYRGSEVATRADLWRPQRAEMVAFGVEVALVGLCLLLLAVKVVDLISRARAKAYYDEQEKRTGVDGGPFRS